MQFTVNQSQLNQALSRIQKGVSNQNTIDVLKGIYIESKEQTLFLTTNNMEIGVQTHLQADIKESGTALIEAKTLIDLVKKIPNQSILFTIDDNFTCSIQSGFIDVEIKSMDPSQFPMLSEQENDVNIHLPVSIFQDMIQKTSFSASADETKPVFMGELIEMKEDFLYIVAMDGFRLAIKKYPFSDMSADTKLIVPTKVLIEINRLIQKEDQQISIGLSHPYVTFHLQNTVVHSRLLEGNFIDYEQIIPADFSTRIEIDRSLFQHSLERAALIGKNNLVKLEIKGDTLEIRSRSDEIGQFKETIPIEKEGEDLLIAFNAKFFTDALRQIEEDTINLHFNSPVSPCILTLTEDENYTYLILPVRI